MDYNNLPPEILLLDRWVCANAGSKVPMQAVRTRAASSSDPSTWASFEDAFIAVRQGIYDYLGFVFNGDGIVGIDIDAGFDDDGMPTELTTDIMSVCRSYTEMSKSGRGIHILIRGKLPFNGRNNGEGVEMYADRRYFIMTGNRLVYPDIIENQPAIDYIVEKYFKYVPPKPGEKVNAQTARIYEASLFGRKAGKIALHTDYPEILPGMRNTSLASLAGQLHSAGKTVEEITTEVKRCNAKACKPPLGDAEVMSIINSVTKYRRD